MAPSEALIIKTIKHAIEEVFHGPNRAELLTVRHIRDIVEEELGLTKGYFLGEDWKPKSKKIIQEYANEVIEAEEQDAVSPEQPKKPQPAARGKKRSSPAVKAPPKKRQKRAATPSEDEELSDISEPSLSESEEESSFGDSEDSDAPKRKSKVRGGPKRQSKKKVSDSEEEESEDNSDDLSELDSEDSDAPKKNTKPKLQDKAKAPVKRESKSKAVVESNSDNAEESDVSPPKKKPTPKKLITKPASESSPPRNEAHKNAFTKAPSSMTKSSPALAKEEAGSESEMSIVLDEPPPKKRASKVSKSNSKPAKAPSKSKPASTKETKDLTADEQTIKTLQSQLRKCGINKIWQFELKQYSDDSRAKIRHLSGMLKEIGMSGRFSEARAREIKEQRELMQDLEAVKEGEKSWGLGRGSRRGGGQERKSLRDESAESDDGKGGGSGSESSEQLKPRAPRAARAALAFLDDDDEESD